MKLLMGSAPLKRLPASYKRIIGEAHLKEELTLTRKSLKIIYMPLTKRL